MGTNNHDAKWHEARRKRIGGSEAGIILGWNEYSTPEDLFKQKLGLTSPPEANAAMERGTYLEDIIVAKYRVESGRTVTIDKEMVTHPEYPYMGCETDGYVEEVEPYKGQGILECKCPGLNTFRKIKEQGLLPYYIAQVQHNMLVTGTEWASVAILNAELWELIWIDVEADLEIQQMLIQKETEFWLEHVEKEIPPGDTEALPVKLPKMDSMLVPMSTDPWQEAADHFAKADKLKKIVKELRDKAVNEIKDLCDAKKELFEGLGLRVSWKWQKGKKSLNTDRFNAEHPDIDLDSYYDEGKPTRSFRPTITKEYKQIGE